jgi:ribonuclease HI
VHHSHSHQRSIFTDGSKDAGSVGCAAVKGDALIVRKLPPQSSIFTAELFAILDAITIASNDDAQSFAIFSDSKSALQALQIYNNNHPIVQQINRWLIRLHSRHKDIQLCWVPSHVGIAGNERADEAAKQAANSNPPLHYSCIPHRDYYSLIKAKCRDAWQTSWLNTTQNKLREIKDTTLPWPSSSQKARSTEILLCRLRLGHTRYTHRHLMEGAHQPFCEDCLVPQTVKHILAECPSHSRDRALIFPTTSRTDSAEVGLTKILADRPGSKFDAGPLLRFISAVGLKNKI